MDSIITPMTQLQRLESISGMNRSSGTQKASEQTSIFQDILQNAMSDVVESDVTAVNDTENLSTGDVDDLHRLGIDNYEASLAVSMLVQIRNRALESYNQIMQTTV